MTPKQYLAQLRELISAGRDQEALDFAAQYHVRMRPQMSAEEVDLVAGALEGAAMAVTMDSRATPNRSRHTKSGGRHGG